MRASAYASATVSEVLESAVLALLLLPSLLLSPTVVADHDIAGGVAYCTSLSASSSTRAEDEVHV